MQTKPRKFKQFRINTEKHLSINDWNEGTDDDPKNILVPRTLELPGRRWEPGPCGSESSEGEAWRAQGTWPTIQLQGHLQNQRGMLEFHPWTDVTVFSVWFVGQFFYFLLVLQDTVLLGRRRRSSLWSQGFSYLQMCQYWVHSPFEWCNEAVVMSSECVGVTVGYSVAWDIKKIQLCPGGWGQGVCSNSLISRMLATVQHFEFNFQFHVLYLFS